MGSALIYDRNGICDGLGDDVVPVVLDHEDHSETLLLIVVVATACDAHREVHVHQRHWAVNISCRNVLMEFQP